MGARGSKAEHVRRSLAGKSAWRHLCRVGADMATLWSGAHQVSAGRVVAFSIKLVVVGGGVDDNTQKRVGPTWRWEGGIGTHVSLSPHDGTAWQLMDPVRGIDAGDVHGKNDTALRVSACSFREGEKRCPFCTLKRPLVLPLSIYLVQLDWSVVCGQEIIQIILSLI